MIKQTAFSSRFFQKSMHEIKKKERKKRGDESRIRESLLTFFRIISIKQQAYVFPECNMFLCKYVAVMTYVSLFSKSITLQSDNLEGYDAIMRYEKTTSQSRKTRR